MLFPYLPTGETPVPLSDDWQVPVGPTGETPVPLSDDWQAPVGPTGETPVRRYEPAGLP